MVVAGEVLEPVGGRNPAPSRPRPDASARVVDGVAGGQSEVLAHLSGVRTNQAQDRDGGFDPQLTQDQPADAQFG